MLTITADSANELQLRVLQHLLNGTDCFRAVPRGQDTTETIGATLRLKHTRCNVVNLSNRHLNYRFMLAEAVWILSGQNDLATMQRYMQRYGDFSDDGHTLAGAYGPPLADQLPWCIQQIERDLHTRQAVLTLWRPRPGPSKDVPCTVAMQFLLRSGQLHMVTTMRSNDAWLGLPYDLFTFTTIQDVVADAIGAIPGTYTHNVGSLHLYERDREAATAVVAAGNGAFAPEFTRRPRWPVPQAARVVLADPDETILSSMALDMPRDWFRYLEALVHPELVLEDVC